jgi:hypothetical protein
MEGSGRSTVAESGDHESKPAALRVFRAPIRVIRAPEQLPHLHHHQQLVL